jgi:hypothetical protein
MCSVALVKIILNHVRYERREIDDRAGEREERWYDPYVWD